MLTAQCSKRKGEKQKGWRRGGDGGGEEAQPLSPAGPGQAGGARGGDRLTPQAGFALRTMEGFGGLSLLGVPSVTSATSAQMGH